MGGNAVRATELARVLAAHGDVTLAAPGEPPEAGAPFRHAAWDAGDPVGLRALLAGAGVVVAAPQSPVVQAELRRSGARLVADLYDPFPLAVLEGLRDASPWRRRLDTTLTLDTFVAALSDAHHAICAPSASATSGSGWLLGAGLRPGNLSADPSLRRSRGGRRERRDEGVERQGRVQPPSRRDASRSPSRTASGKRWSRSAARPCPAAAQLPPAPPGSAAPPTTPESPASSARSPPGSAASRAAWRRQDGPPAGGQARPT